MHGPEHTAPRGALEKARLPGPAATPGPSIPRAEHPPPDGAHGRRPPRAACGGRADKVLFNRL